MSVEDKDRKAEPTASGPRPTVKTVVGVPLLGREATGAGPTRREAVPKGAARQSPGVVGALAKPPLTSSPIHTPPLGADLFPAAADGRQTRPRDIRKATRPGVAPQQGENPTTSIEEISSSLLLPDDADEVPSSDVQELSGSVLLDEPSQPPADPRAAYVPLPAPPAFDLTVTPQPSAGADANAAIGAEASVDGEPGIGRDEPIAPEPPAAGIASLPFAAPSPSELEITRLPRSGFQPIVAAFRDFLRGHRRTARRVVARDARSPWVLPGVAMAGLVVGIGIVGIVAALMRTHRDPKTASSAPSAPSAPDVVIVPANLPPAPPSATPAGACTVVGASHVIAPSAIVAAGVEAHALGSDVALGFASNDHEAMAVRVDLASVSVTEMAVARSPDPIRRVTPMVTPRGTLGVGIDVDRKSDRVQGRRTLPVIPALQVGAADGQLVWAPFGRAPKGKLWPLDGRPTVEAVRGATSETDPGIIALAFRSAGATWVGAIESSSAVGPKGGLSRIEGLGPSVGSPAVAIRDGVILMAWADRPSSDDPWRLRWVRFRVGEAPGEQTTFSPPPGGKGEQTMSPGLASIPGGFLLVWTEGPPSGHDVRALTLSLDGAPRGAPLQISNEGVNAGQAQAAVAADGRGLVAFLESGGAGFQIVAKPIVCSP